MSLRGSDRGKETMLKRVAEKHNIPIFIAVLLAVIFFINALTVKNTLIGEARNYIYVFSGFWVTAQTLHKAIKTRSNSALLYGALGFSCLTLGLFYFLVIHFASIELEYISVGNYSVICCNVFFLSALMALKENRSARHKFFAITVNVLTSIATIMSTLAVIINSEPVINSAYIMLDILVITVAGSLLASKIGKKNLFAQSFFAEGFFALMMLIVALCDLIGELDIIPLFSLLFWSFAHVIYLLMGRGLIMTKVEA